MLFVPNSKIFTAGNQKLYALYTEFEIFTAGNRKRSNSLSSTYNYLEDINIHHPVALDYRQLSYYISLLYQFTI